MSEDTNLIIRPADFLQRVDSPGLLSQVRPVWQARNLIARVRKLIEVDPSSACQRLFNAAIHDLREKIIVAGVDIAGEAARQHKLPPVARQEDIENYSVSNIVDLAYRMGLLTRPEWRRVSRCYEIRRDLEHEDDEYEAGIEDCIYIFKTCIDVVLSKDPVHLLRVEDVKDLIEQPGPVVPSEALLEDYERAPQPRQEQIQKLLISIALDSDKSEILQQNAYNFISKLEPLTKTPVKLALASHVQERVGRKGLDRRLVRVAQAAGVLPYLRQAEVVTFFRKEYEEFEKVGVGWLGYSEHGGLLRSFIELGAFTSCPPALRRNFLKWMMLTYIGEPGGRTSWGNVRNVFYSNSAAPIIKKVIREQQGIVGETFRGLVADPEINEACQNNHIQRRLDELLDLLESP